MKLVMLSGGLDSTAALYKLLTETKDPLHVHHIVLRNVEYRWEAEMRAVAQIVPYLQNIRPFTYTESMWGFLQFKYHFAWDTNVVFFTAAQIVKNTNSIDTLVAGKCKDDETDSQRHKELIDQHREIWRACFLHENISIPELSFPVGKMNKGEIGKLLPSALVGMTWSCRTPQRAPNGVFVRCEKCSTCKILKTYDL